MDVLPDRSVLGLAGPTASGKSSVALLLSDTAPIEVVTVDAFQVYRGMDVGTAKPTAEDRARLPHHLLDLCDPRETYSAARFLADAEGAVAEIRARGRVPLLVGGTMLYFLALARGLFDAPAPDPDRRAARAKLGREQLLALLEARDSAAARELADAPSRRLARALEILDHEPGPLAAARAKSRPASFAVELYALVPEIHAAHRAVAERTEAIFARGLLDEVAALRRAGVTPDLPSQRAIGYREGHLALGGEIDPTEARRRVEIATRRLAKRQRTWLRNSLAVAARHETAEKARSALARRIETMVRSAP